jgi:hypothetical protein
MNKIWHLLHSIYTNLSHSSIDLQNYLIGSNFALNLSRVMSVANKVFNFSAFMKNHGNVVRLKIYFGSVHYSLAGGMS